MEETLSSKPSINRPRETYAAMESAPSESPLLRSAPAIMETGGAGSVRVALRGGERIRIIVAFALVACMGSILTGSFGGFSPNTILSLQSDPGKYGVDPKDFHKDTFSVSEIVIK